jgi:hypothetical protein
MLPHHQALPPAKNPGHGRELSGHFASRLNSLVPIYAHRIIYTPSSLEYFGIWRYKRVRLLRNQHKARNRPDYAEDTVIWEEDVYSWASRILSNGLQWKRRTLNRGLLSTLRAYPIFSSDSDVGKAYISLIERGNVDDIRTALQSGEMHPLMCDEYGKTLLHVRHCVILSLRIQG